MARVRPRRPATLLAGLLLAGCTSLESGNDWWSVRASGQGDQARLHSTSHVNHGRPARESPIERRLLREARRGTVSVAVHRDAALAGTWPAAAPVLAREVDEALDWMARVAGEQGASLVVTLVDDEHAVDVEHVNAAHPPVVELYVAADESASSRSAAVGRALAKGLHEVVHAVSAARGDAGADRLAEERRASLVEACYLLDTVRPGDTVALNAAAAHPHTDNFAILQSRAAAAAVVGELRRLAGATTVRPDDREARAALRRHCDQAAGSGR